MTQLEEQTDRIATNTAIAVANLARIAEMLEDKDVHAVIEELSARN